MVAAEADDGEGRRRTQDLCGEDRQQGPVAGGVVLVVEVVVVSGGIVVGQVLVVVAPLVVVVGAGTEAAQGLQQGRVLVGVMLARAQQRCEHGIPPGRLLAQARARGEGGGRRGRAAVDPSFTSGGNEGNLIRRLVPRRSDGATCLRTPSPLREAWRRA